MKLDIIGKRKIFFGISIVALVLVLIITIVVGPKLDIQFKGGSIATYTYTGDITPDEFGKTVESFLGQDVTVQKQENSVTGQTSMVVSLTSNKNLTTETQTGLLEELQTTYADNEIEASDINNVDPVMGMEFFKKCIVAVVFASVIMIVYIGFRFRKIGGLKAGSTAIVALLHDMFVVFGVFVLLRIPLNGNFIAALLTILGYSINDTVVIYDRIRENSALYGKKQMSLAELVNLSVNQSFARSLMTSITTCLALGVVCVVSVIYRLDSIYSFAFPLLFGMVSGVYSTICIATPLWVDWKNKKKAAKKA